MENALLYGSIVGGLFLIFPIFLSLDVFVSSKQNKLFFSLYIFNFFKIIGGYAVIRKDGIVFHISKKKAIFKPFKEMMSERKKFEITAGFQIVGVKSCLEIGDKNYPLAGFYTLVLTSAFPQIIYPILQNKRPFLNLNHATLLLHGQDKIKVTANLTAVFNQLTIIIAFSKVILEAIINLWQKKKREKISRV